MKRVQHNEVKAGMKLRLTEGYGLHGRWVCIDHVYEIRKDSVHVRAYWHSDTLKGGPVKRFGLALYQQKDGYELHPQTAFLTAKEVMRKGRADVQNIVLREYTVKFVAVGLVDNQGRECGYCDREHAPITCNVYATVTDEMGRPEESAWSTCDRCALPSIDQVEDVDPSHTITIERVAR